MFQTITFFFMESKSFLVFGKNGWIGGMVIKQLRDRGFTVYEAESRLENTQDVCAELDRVKPDYVMNAAGLVCSSCCS